jgi:hypothetical protein
MILRRRKMKLFPEAVGSLIFLLMATSFVFSQAQQIGKSASCGLPPSRKVDEYSTSAREEEQQRLEKLLLALGLEKDSHAFIVTYGGRSSTIAEAQKHADGAKRYLVEKQAFYAGAELTNSHINTLFCGFRDAPSTELWITPLGAAPPLCAPTIAAPVRSKPRVLRNRH